MARVTGSTAGGTGRRSSSYSPAARKRGSVKTSKPRKRIGRITKEGPPASEPYELSLHRDLRNADVATELLTECFNDEFEATFLTCLRHVVMAYGGVAKSAKASGLNRESLCKVPSRGGNPEVNTLRKIVGALKMKIVFARA